MQPKLVEDLKQAQLARDETKVSVLRMLISEIRYSQISKGSELTDQEIQSVIQKELKKRKEAATGFRQGQREEQAQKEDVEAAILQSYLPQQLSGQELTNLVQEAIKEVGASSIQDMGKVISLVMSKAAGQVEGARVSTLVKEKLGSV